MTPYYADRDREDIGRPVEEDVAGIGDELDDEEFEDELDDEVEDDDTEEP